jgi:hypothetical protein
VEVSRVITGIKNVLRKKERKKEKGNNNNLQNGMSFTLLACSTGTLDKSSTILSYNSLVMT